MEDVANSKKETETLQTYLESEEDKIKGSK